MIKSVWYIKLHKAAVPYGCWTFSCLPLLSQVLPHLGIALGVGLILEAICVEWMVGCSSAGVSQLKRLIFSNKSLTGVNSQPPTYEFVGGSRKSIDWMKNKLMIGKYHWEISQNNIIMARFHPKSSIVLVNSQSCYFLLCRLLRLSWISTMFCLQGSC